MIPNWFDDTYHHAAVELGDARHALDEQHREDARIERRIHDLTDDLNQLQPECEPHDTAIAAARSDVTEAQDRHRRAVRAVTDSGPLGRRAARRDLADATDELATAETALAERTRSARTPRPTQPTRNERDPLSQHATTNRNFLDDSTTTRPLSLTLNRQSTLSTPGSAGRRATRCHWSNSSRPSMSSTPTER